MAEPSCGTDPPRPTAIAGVVAKSRGFGVADLSGTAGAVTVVGAAGAGVAGAGAIGAGAIGAGAIGAGAIGAGA
ncbi:hypothetical protein, partial [Nonomuraea dietziae]|uniref:hypothetical protein n=1 Tax=Nonomuraea dietziae TaxID=65515 RepID=UPI0034131D18